MCRSHLPRNMSTTVATKKGFVYPSDATTCDKLAALNAKWHYNWNVTPPANLAPEIPYTPQIWGAKTLAYIGAASHSVILGFNEPDGAKQANLTVDQAISHWPELMATGARLGSPATAGNPTNPAGWLAQFMEQAAAKNYRVDFIAVHWYAPPNATSFLKEIDAIYALYKLPIWITEFSPADWNASPTTPCKFVPADAIQFMNVVIPELEKRDYVERYTWKTRTPDDVNLGFAALFNADGTLSDVGKAYAAL